MTGADVRAQEHLRRGLSLRKQAHDVEALAEFQLAQAAHPSGRARAQIAFAEQALGRWVAAESDLEAALASDDTWVATHRDALTQSLGYIAAHLGWLHIESNVEGAELRINGAVVGRAPLREAVRVVAGSAQVHVEADDYLPIERAVTVEAGGHAREAITLLSRPIPAPAPAPVLADAPPVPAVKEPPPARPDVSSAPPAPPESAPRDSAPNSLRTVGLVGSAGVGVAALAVTAYFGIRAVIAEERKPATCLATDIECRNRADSLEDQRTTNATIATVAGGVALAAAASTLVFLVLPRAARGNTRTSTAIRVAPLGVGGATLSIPFY
jgi:hypothetical protein